MFLFSEKYLQRNLIDVSTRDKAFVMLVKQYKEKVYWLVRRVVIDHKDAEDIAQDVFVKAWQGLDYFQGQSDIFTWIYRIALNESLNHLRKKCRQATVSLDEAGEYLLSVIDRNEYVDSGDEMYVKLEKAVAQLPEKQRIVFILRYFEQRDYREIAAITGTSEGALHASYHLAIKKIEKKLSEN